MSADQVTEFLATHAFAAPWLALVLAAVETTALLSLLIPSTALLMGVGAAVATGALPFLPIWMGAAFGAVIGSSFSWWLGRRFGTRILALWPMRDHPDLMARAQAAFARWGAFAVVVGHFFGPLRSVVFLFAGLSGMPFWRFQIINIVGAVGWAFIIPKTGELGGNLLGWFWQFLGV